MGCHGSKLAVMADDSIHVMLKHDKQHRPYEASAYVPRTPHPLLAAAKSGSGHNLTVAEESSEAGDSSQGLDGLIFHAAHHNDTIDRRDLAEYGAGEEPAL